MGPRTSQRHAHRHACINQHAHITSDTLEPFTALEGLNPINQWHSRRRRQAFEDHLLIVRAGNEVLNIRHSRTIGAKMIFSQQPTQDRALSESGTQAVLKPRSCQRLCPGPQIGPARLTVTNTDACYQLCAKTPQSSLKLSTAPVLEHVFPRKHAGVDVLLDVIEK